jgi:hypothetical protein
MAHPYEPYSPYCGLTYNEKNQPVRAQGAPHVAISAPTRTGKTRRILAMTVSQREQKRRAKVAQDLSVAAQILRLYGITTRLNANQLDELANDIYTGKTGRPVS